MDKKCDFCNVKSKGETTIDNRWTFRNCGSNECKRKQTIIIKLLIGDLSDKTVLAIARTIPEKELYKGEKII